MSISKAWLIAIAIMAMLGCKQSDDSAPVGSKSSYATANRKAIPPGFDFSLIDQNGTFHQLSRYRDSNAVVLISHGIGCPIVRQSVQAINALHADFASKGIEILMINPFNQDSLEQIQQEAREYKLKVPVLLDKSQFISWSLGFTRTAEVVVIDPKQWRIVYRGPLNDRLDYEIQKKRPLKQFLRDYLNDLLAGKAGTEPIELPFKGCAITYDDSYLKPDFTYAQHAAKILQKRCATCHVEGGIAPWAMTDYNVVKNWSFMMREVIKTRRMPPWHADDPHGLLSNSIQLSADEERALLLWMNNGCPRGEGPDPLQSNTHLTKRDWVLGEPDQIIHAGEYSIPATGTLPYRYVVVDLNNDTDLYIKAVHLRPTNKRILHHGFSFVIPPTSYQLHSDDPIGSNWRVGVFSTYVPGVDGEINPSGIVRFIPAHSKMKFELHYTTTGKEDSGDVLLGLYFTTADSTAKHYKMDAVFDRWFRVPPGASDWPVHASTTFEKNSTLYEMMPHMHYRGKSMRYTLIYPDGKEQQLLSVPRFDFNWQRQYRLLEPLQIPAGSTLHVDGAFDNSDLNPFNPDPAQTVGFGSQTTDEMFIGYITYTEDN